MIKQLTILILSCLLCFSVSGQNQEVNQIGSALKQGNAEELAFHLAPTVSIGLNRVEKTYSRPQAQQVLQAFFDKNRVTDFVYRHSGKSEHKDQFNVGTLTTEKGIYRITYFLIQAPKGNKIKRLRIEQK